MTAASPRGGRQHILKAKIETGVVMLKEFPAEIIRTVKQAVTMAPTPCTSILTLVMGLREYNLNPIQVRYQAALRPDSLTLRVY